jgi:hypothetical protein
VGDDLDDIDLGLLAVGLDNGQSERGDPSDRVTGFTDDVGAGPEPLLDFMSANEEVGDGFERELGDVETGLVGLFLAQEILIPQLTVDLRASANKSDSVDAGHDRLLDGLSFDVIWQFFGNLVNLLICILALEVFADHLDDHLRHVRIDVAGLLPRAQVDLVGALHVTTQGCVMLQSVTATVLVYVHVRDVVFWVVRPQRPR